MQASSPSFLGAQVSKVPCCSQTFDLVPKEAMKCRIAGSASPPTKHNRTPAEMNKRMLDQEPNAPRRQKEDAIAGMIPGCPRRPPRLGQEVNNSRHPEQN
jgi:hypothetical protein